MKRFFEMFGWAFLLIALVFAGANGIVYCSGSPGRGRPHQVEIHRLEKEIAENGFSSLDLSECRYVVKVEKDRAGADFFHSDSAYAIREIKGERYRFDYIVSNGRDGAAAFAMNAGLLVMACALLSVLLFVHLKILRPFARLSNLPYELAKGNLTAPMEESRSRYFGNFIWGLNLLREHLERQKQRELSQQREKNTLLLSLSHDIKTPLSAIKLYAKAILRGLYAKEGQMLEIAGQIDAKADEISALTAQIMAASKEDDLCLTVHMGEFYLSELLGGIVEFYQEKLSLAGIGFFVGESKDCLLRGDLDRSKEALQNIMENAIKYGDGGNIGILTSEEEGCVLIAISNSGCALQETELPQIFESFWRGSNAKKAYGNGLGLYICRQLMRKMGGEAYAEIKEGKMWVTAVFGKA